MPALRFMWLLLVTTPVISWSQPVEAPHDSTAGAEVLRRWYSPSDSISARQFLSTHSFSFDHFLQYLPGILVQRQGPIGSRATYSRFGMGRGRGAVYLGAVELNDPQDGLVPLALVPTTAVGTLLRDSGPPGRLSGHHDIEGALLLVEPQPNPGEPLTAFDVSKGEAPKEINRRARFSSAPARFGADFSYDELRSNGYNFDARDVVRGRDYGRSATRMQSGAIRGTLAGERYAMAFRDFESSFQGDESSIDAEYRRNGFIASLESTVRDFDLALYARSYRVSTPDSATNNTTTSVRANLPLSSTDNTEFRLQVGYDDIVSTQRVGGRSAAERLQVGEASINGIVSFSKRRNLCFGLDAARQFDNAPAWATDFALAQGFGRQHRITLFGKRGYRLPTLGELFLPFHSAGADSVVGNRNLDAESSLEAGLRVQSGFGLLRNNLRLTALRVKPILPVVVSTSPYVLRSPRNVDAENIQMVEERFEARRSLWGFDFSLAAGGDLAFGSREGYFEGVPQFRAVGSASLGRDLFRNTSGLVVTGEYQHCGERKDGGHTLPSYGVFNLKLDVRLVEFRAYLLLLNLFDEKYQTAYPFWMTPTTFVYGATWLFNS